MTYNIELRQKIKEKELRIENIAPFGGSFIKCLIDPRPPMSLQVASCRTHQKSKDFCFAHPICNAIWLPIAAPGPGRPSLSPTDDWLPAVPLADAMVWYLSGQQQAINSYQEQQQPAAQAKGRKQQASDPIT